MGSNSGDRTDIKSASNKEALSRRGFLRTGAIAGIGSAAALSGVAPAAADRDEGIRWDAETDVLVIGAGASGLPACIAARDAGAEVLVVEHHFDIGGIAIMSAPGPGSSSG